MAEPETVAGRRLATELFTDTRIFNGESVTEYILAIEADARADLLTELRAAVEGLPEWHCSPCGEGPGDHGNVARAAVLALLEPPR